MPITEDLQHLRDWIGRTETRREHLHLTPAAALAATLDHDTEPAVGSELPQLWHWVYFTPLTLAGDIGDDGHAKRGGFLPPVPLPRRMWAGGRFTFHHPLRIGDEVERISRIADVQIKHGRSGTLVFVTVQHEFRNAQGLALVEDHDIVYREMPSPDAPAAAALPPPSGPTYGREITADPVLLFRYSALTFNGHRIHYDRSYVTEVEGYPGLIVHGPLIATLLLDLLRREQPHARVRSFNFKSSRPIFDIHRFSVHGRTDGTGQCTLWAQDFEGALAMQAQAAFD